SCKTATTKGGHGGRARLGLDYRYWALRGHPGLGGKCPPSSGSADVWPVASNLAVANHQLLAAIRGGFLPSAIAIAEISGRMKNASSAGYISVRRPWACSSSDTAGPTEAIGVHSSPSRDRSSQPRV